MGVVLSKYDTATSYIAKTIFDLLWYVKQYLSGGDIRNEAVSSSDPTWCVNHTGYFGVGCCDCYKWWVLGEEGSGVFVGSNVEGCAGMLFVIMLISVLTGGILAALNSVTGLSGLLIQAWDIIIGVIRSTVGFIINIFDGTIDFANYGGIRGIIARLLAPIAAVARWSVGKLNEIYGGIEEHLPGINSKLLAFGFVEAVSIFAVWAWKQIQELGINFKSSLGGRMFSKLDKPFQWVRSELSDRLILRIIFNLFSFPLEINIFGVCVLVDVLTDLF